MKLEKNSIPYDMKVYLWSLFLFKIMKYLQLFNVLYSI